MSHIDPSREHFQIFKDLDRTTPIQMLNLIKLRDKAAYPDGRDLTGAEAYANYGRFSGPVFQRVGGSILWRGRPECMLIGPAEEMWDIAFIAAYPHAGAFLDMVTDKTYQTEAVPHRQAAVRDSRLIRHHPLDGSGEFG